MLSLLTVLFFVGEKALRDIIKQARHVGALANDSKIKNMCDDLDKMLDRLTELRTQGLVRFLDSSPNFASSVIPF